MRVWMERTRGLLLFTLLPLAACGDDGVTPRRTPADEVAGSYRICALEFTPSSRFLPAVDIRAKAFELEAGGVTPPRLKLDRTRAFELEFTPRGQFTDVEHRGTFGTGDAEVILTFTRPTDVAPLLLPSILRARWNEQAKTLTSGGGLPYSVAKSDYEWMLGESDPGIPSRVEGTLTARFALGGCN